MYAMKLVPGANLTLAATDCFGAGISLLAFNESMKRTKTEDPDEILTLIFEECRKTFHELAAKEDG